MAIPMTSWTAPQNTGRVASQSFKNHWFTAFEPLPPLHGGHVQTLVGNYWLRPPFRVPFEPEAVEVDPADGSRVLCHCHWQREQVRSERLTILLVHGLEGSSDSRYIQGITARAWDAGCNVIRMNMRNCGGTDTWTPTLYHSGLSADVLTVLSHFADRQGLKRVAMAGYSMGGNLVLKLAGELGGNGPEWLRAAVGVSPAVDLAASADALGEPANRMYEWNFLKNLKRRFRRKVSLFPEIYSVQDLLTIRSVREFDDRITARYSGFAGADDYYFRAASARVVSQIAIPTLVLHALDDPFIRLTPETRSALMQNPAIELVETEHGGHCAFLAKTPKVPGEDAGREGSKARHWAEATLVRFLLATAGHADGG
jgi:predicted alpha/beta-fold hydrolase